MTTYVPIETAEQERERLAQAPEGSLSHSLSRLPVTITEHLQDLLIELPLQATGREHRIVIVPIEPRGITLRQRHSGSWVCIVVESDHPSYPVGGHRLVVSTAELVRGCKVTIEQSPKQDFRARIRTPEMARSIAKLFLDAGFRLNAFPNREYFDDDYRSAIQKARDAIDLILQEGAARGHTPEMARRIVVTGGVPDDTLTVVSRQSDQLSARLEVSDEGPQGVDPISADEVTITLDESGNGSVLAAAGRVDHLQED